MIKWDTEFDLEFEKTRALGVLGKIVPQSEIFMTTAQSSKGGKKL